MDKKVKMVTIGSGSPRVAIVSCMHGNEVIGEYVAKHFKKQKLLKGTLGFVVANERAKRLKRRFVVKDMNRCFPGKKNGCHEERLAYELTKLLKPFDFVVDLHGTDSDISEMAIVGRLTAHKKRLLSFLPLSDVAGISPKVFGGSELISRHPGAIALEYGPYKDGRMYKRAIAHTRVLLTNLGMLRGKRRVQKKKTLYRILGTYSVPKGFKQNPKLNDLERIRKGDLIGSVGEKKIYAKESFYPLFLGRGTYPGLLSLIASREKITL